MEKKINPLLRPALIALGAGEYLSVLAFVGLFAWPSLNDDQRVFLMLATAAGAVAFVLLHFGVRSALLEFIKRSVFPTDGRKPQVPLIPEPIYRLANPFGIGNAKLRSLVLVVVFIAMFGALIFLTV